MCRNEAAADAEQTKYLPLCDEHLPGYPISHIGFSTTYARLFFPVPNVSFNMLQVPLMGPIGSAFIRKAKMLNREIFAWTVNDEKKMRWCIRRELDGVITDDPKKFLDVCEDYMADGERIERFSVKEVAHMLRIHLFLFVVTIIFKVKFGYRLDQRFVVQPRRLMEAKEEG